MNGHTRTFNAYPKTDEFRKMGLCNRNKMSGSIMKVPNSYVLDFLKDYYFDSTLYRETISSMLGFTPGLETFKDIQEAITGYDIVAGKELTKFEKGAVVVAVAIPFVNKETVKFAVQTGEVTVNLVIDFGKVAKNSILESDLLRSLKRVDSSAYEQFVNKTGRGLAGDIAEGAGNYANYAKIATKNAGSSEVVLGKFNHDGISYVKVAEARGSSYFQLDAWDDIAKTVGDKNMWNINEQFLQQQMAQGKSFVLTHNPYQATGYFAQEVDFLTRNGYKFVQNGSMWNAIK